jgi:hypothetical protein
MKSFHIRSLLCLILALALLLALIVQTDTDTRYLLITLASFSLLMFISYKNAKLLNAFLFGCMFVASMISLNNSANNAMIKKFEIRMIKSLHPLRERLDPRNFDERDEQIRYEDAITIRVVFLDLWISSIFSLLLVVLISRALEWGGSRSRARSEFEQRT